MRAFVTLPPPPALEHCTFPWRAPILELTGIACVVSVGAADGTSAAVPVIAAVVALLNDARTQAGKPSLGFLNPLIYSILDQGLGLFNDITLGHNPGCGSPGFWAHEGWDPVTGAGTPDFGRLREYVVGLA